MIIIPAIDILDKQCVRLKEGKFDQKTVYFNDPVDAAKHWLDEGAQRLHVVDLDGARNSDTTNFDIISKIVNVMGEIPVQVGGGIRNLDRLTGYFNIGIAGCILGTATVNDKEFFINACQKFPNKIIAGLDANEDKIAISGWEEQSNINLFEYAKWCGEVGAALILYTDIARDGMLSGVNLDNLRKLSRESKVPVIASGGVANIDDVKSLIDCPEEFFGVITGRALYQKTLSLAHANSLIKNH